jgi:hypothetical protein
VRATFAVIVATNFRGKDDILLAKTVHSRLCKSGKKNFKIQRRNEHQKRQQLFGINLKGTESQNFRPLTLRGVGKLIFCFDFALHSRRFFHSAEPKYQCFCFVTAVKATGY